MKKTNFLFGAVAALAMGGAFTACSDDAMNNGIDNGKVEKDQTRYLNVSICNPTQGSRAAASDFQTATAAENYVDQLYFVFYDAQGAVIDYHQLQFTNNTNTDNGGGGTFTPEGDDQSAGSVGKIWQSTIPVEMTAGQNMPSYVMAFVNPITPADILTSSLSEVENLLRDQVRNEDEHFPMSNSVFYGTNPITGQSQVRMVATPITTAQLYNTPAEATANPAVEIFVERYASKVNLTLEAGNIKDNTADVNGYTLKFVPEYWRPNAIDKNTYVVKHYGLNNNGVVDFAPTFAELDRRLTGWEWNDVANSRSYWACSPSYYANAYPKVSDDIEDGNTYSLHYFSYNEIKDSKIGEKTTSSSIAYDNGFSNPFYARETTASSDSWQNPTDYNPAAVVTSAVIVGRYKLTANGDAAPVADNTTFYLYGKTNDKWNLYLEDGIVEAMAANQNIVLDATTHAPIKVSTAFKVDHPSKDVRDIKGTVVAGRFVSLQLSDAALAAGYVYYDPTDENAVEGYVVITDANADKVNSDLFTAGYARKYGEGLAYFSIPVQHLGFNQTGELDYTTARAGSFGLVRNHVYTINIQSITGLATALRDADQPIVPPMDEQTYYISAKLNVLNWRIVPTQNVIL